MLRILGPASEKTGPDPSDPKKTDTAKNRKYILKVMQKAFWSDPVHLKLDPISEKAESYPCIPKTRIRPDPDLPH